MEHEFEGNLEWVYGMFWRQKREENGCNYNII